jgi:hypothetical protein
MKISFLPLYSFLFAALVAEAADVYVSNAGFFRNSGSIDSPLANVPNAVSLASAGDTVFLERGSVFRVFSLSIDKEITVRDYGDPALPPPVLLGSEAVSDWSPWAENPAIYVASLNSRPTHLYVDRELATLARTPNIGWLRDDQGTTSDLIVDAALVDLPGNAPDRWTGAQVRWRKWSWWYETRPITDDDGAGNLTLGGSTFSSQVLHDGGYYIDNSKEALDAPGEWFWEESTQKLYYYPQPQVDPNDLEIEAELNEVGVRIRAGRLLGIAFRHYYSSAISISGTATIEDCFIDGCGRNGITGVGSIRGSVIRNNRIRDVLNVGISWRETGGTGQTVIESNILERIGVVPGLGGSGSWHAAGVILSRGNGIQFRKNRIERTGYAGIIVGEAGQTVEHNFFRYCMSTLNDGAGIYTNCGDTMIRENIILETIGDLDSSHPWYNLGHGIWPEFLGNYSDNQIIGNTVYGCGGNGLWLPNNFNALVADNKFLSNINGDIDLGGFEPTRSDGFPNQNNVLSNNVIGDTAIPYRVLEPQNLRDDNVPVDVRLTYHLYDDRNLLYGSMSGTTFLVQEEDDPLVGASTGAVVGTIASANMTYLSIAEWQATEPDWADPAPEVWEGDAYLFINDTSESYTFVFDETLGTETWRSIAWLNSDVESAGDELVVPPFQSALLFSPSGVIDGLEPYFLASEVESPRMTYETWIATYDSLTTEERGETADPDGDGWNNSAEYYANRSPVSGDGLDLGPLAIVEAGGTTYLRMQRRSDLPRDGFSATLESSPDLTSWTVEAELAGATDDLAWRRDSTGRLEYFAIPIAATEDGAAAMRAWRIRFAPTDEK